MAIILDTFIGKVKESFSRGENINLVGFGNFEIAKRAARQARNFKTKEIINVPASKTVKFKPGKGLKDAVI